MNIKEEMPNYYKILERMENSTHSILDYVIASAFDECTYDELERAAAELARITAERGGLIKLIEHLKEMNDDALMNGSGAWSSGGETDQWVVAALKQSS